MRTLASLEFYPDLSSDHIWGKSRAYLQAFTANFETYLEMMTENLPKNGNKIPAKGVAKEALKHLLLDFWLSVKGRASIFSANDNSRILEALETKNLELLISLFKLDFLEKSSLPTHVKSSSRLNKTWRDKSNFFFPADGYGKKSKMSTTWKSLSHVRFWTETLNAYDSKFIFRVTNEIHALFIQLEWIPVHRGQQAIWEKKKMRYNIYLNESKFLY
jgi:hypothetical protein